jgi:hypothetical protein
MSSRNQRSLESEIALAEQHCRDDATSITNWYQLRRNQALMELERLENAYNERMAEHSVEWSQRLSDLYSQRDAVPPIPKLTRQTNWHIMHQEEVDAIEQEMLDDSFLPLQRQQNVQYLSPLDFDYMTLPVAPMDLYLEEDAEQQQQHVIDVLAHMSSVHIVSDDEDEDDFGVGSSSGEEMC